jgi:hypothetical protein
MPRNVAKAIQQRKYIPGLMIVDGNGTIAWKRASTDLPPGKTIAELWDEQVREQLDLLLAEK